VLKDQLFISFFTIRCFVLTLLMSLMLITNQKYKMLLNVILESQYHIKHQNLKLKKKKNHGYNI